MLLQEIQEMVGFRVWGLSVYGWGIARFGVLRLGPAVSLGSIFRNYPRRENQAEEL